MSCWAVMLVMGILFTTFPSWANVEPGWTFRYSLMLSSMKLCHAGVRGTVGAVIFRNISFWHRSSVVYYLWKSFSITDLYVSIIASGAQATRHLRKRRRGQAGTCSRTVDR